MSKKTTSTAISQHSLFGPPPILEGEDAAAYDELSGRFCAAIKPIDVIDEMFMADVVALEWELLRWRRLNVTLIRARVLEALEDFLQENLDYAQYRKHYEKELTTVLLDNLAEDEAEDAQALAHACARNEPAAMEKVNDVLASIGLTINGILNRSQVHKAQELAQRYVRREPRTVTVIQRLLGLAGVTIETLTATALAHELDVIERIDRLATIAESRRDACLREIDRRRAGRGETLRQTMQEIDDCELDVVEATPAKGEKAG